MVLDREVLAKAKLTVSEFAKFVKYTTATGEERSVTRMAVYNWLKGREVKGKYLEGVESVLRKIDAGIESGILPIGEENQEFRASILDKLLG